MNVIFDQFNSILPISEKEINEIKPLLKTRTLQKDEFLLEANQLCNYMTFINKGSLRSFHLKQNGGYINLMLNSNNDFVSDLESFTMQTPSNVYIQAIEKTEITTLSKNDLEYLYKQNLYWNTLGRKLTEQVFIVSKRRLETLLYKKPKERYLELLKHSPEFLDKYSLTDIASFIGVTPQSLSRIRTKI